MFTFLLARCCVITVAAASSSKMPHITFSTFSMFRVVHQHSYSHSHIWAHRNINLAVFLAPDPKRIAISTPFFYPCPRHLFLRPFLIRTSSPVFINLRSIFLIWFRWNNCRLGAALKNHSEFTFTLQINSKEKTKVWHIVTICWKNRQQQFMHIFICECICNFWFKHCSVFYSFSPICLEWPLTI